VLGVHAPGQLGIATLGRDPDQRARQEILRDGAQDAIDGVAGSLLGLIEATQIHEAVNQVDGDGAAERATEADCARPLDPLLLEVDGLFHPAAHVQVHGEVLDGAGHDLDVVECPRKLGRLAQQRQTRVVVLRLGNGPAERDEGLDLLRPGACLARQLQRGPAVGRRVPQMHRLE
jgi:hypothetical protein